MKKLFLIFTIIVCWTMLSVAQVVIQPRQAEYNNKGVIYFKELAFDFRINTVRGFSVAANIGKIVSYYKTQFIHIELGSLRHPKEFKQNDQFSRRFGNSFIFGKQNSFFALRGGWGEKRYLSEKASRKGVAIGITYEIGPSIGITKPYYLRFTKEVGTPGVVFEERYSPENHVFFTDVNKIEGAASFGKGLTEIGIIPGGQFKLGLHFDWGAFDEYVKAMEIGIMGDFYFKEVPILIEDTFEGAKNRPVFINLYVALQLGKRS